MGPEMKTADRLSFYDAVRAGPPGDDSTTEKAQGVPDAGVPYGEAAY
jgi:hypothetical protein